MLETLLMILGAMGDELLSQSSLTILTLAHDNPDRAERDSVLN